MQEAAHPEANIIFGAVIDDNIGDECRITVIAAGFDTPASETQDMRTLGRADERPAVAEAAFEEPVAEEPEQPIREEAPQVQSIAPERNRDLPRSLPDETPTRFDNSDLDIPDFLK